MSPPYVTHKKNVLARSAGISVEGGAGSNRPYPYERNMTTYLERAYDEGWLWHTDWEHEPLPVRHAPQQVPPGHVD